MMKSVKQVESHVDLGVLGAFVEYKMYDKFI